MAKEHQYCCCAIPLLNVGIYLTLIEQFTVGLLAGILAIATPQIVGADVPSFGPWLFAAGCFVACGVQALGFIGVFKEKASLFQRFVQVNSFVVAYIFGVAATWIVVSATRHNTAETNCVADFFTNTTSNPNATDVFAAGGEGDTICNIFVWVDIGLMGGLWLIMALFQGYLILICSWYGASQLADHSKYYSIYSVTAPEGINLGERQQQDAWDPRPSTDSWSGVAGAGNIRSAYRDHSRQNSDITERAYGVGTQDFQKQLGYGYQSNSPDQHDAYNPYINHPDQAYTNETEPTPVALTAPERGYAASNTYGGQPVSQPAGAMYPNEGQFGRKTPRAEDAYGAGHGGAGASGAYVPSTAPTYYTEKQQYYNPQR